MAWLTLWGLLGLWCCGAVALDAWGHRGVSGRPLDAIVVAGCRVEEGGVASRALQERVRRAVALYNDGVAPVIVFTGGVGDYPPAESVAAQAFARTLGLPEDASRVEELSTSTEENAEYAAKLLGSEARVVVVTDSYHAFRAARVFGRHFAYAEGIGRTPRPYYRVRGSLREVPAVLWYAAKGWL